MVRRWPLGLGVLMVRGRISVLGQGWGWVYGYGIDEATRSGWDNLTTYLTYLELGGGRSMPMVRRWPLGLGV